ncbi:MAG: DUF4446 family protein [Chloroflexota bacterium]
MVEVVIAVGAAIVAAGSALLAFRAERRLRALRVELARAPSQAEIGRRITSLAARLEESESRLGAVEATADRALVHVGLVRFNAFEGVGGQQSFALALLDPHADGVVVSALHARDTTRVYVKPILGGTPSGPLADEEVAALRDAGIGIPPAV